MVIGLGFNCIMEDSTIFSPDIISARFSCTFKRSFNDSLKLEILGDIRYTMTR